MVEPPHSAAAKHETPVEELEAIAAGQLIALFEPRVQQQLTQQDTKEHQKDSSKQAAQANGVLHASACFAAQPSTASYLTPSPLPRLISPTKSSSQRAKQTSQTPTATSRRLTVVPKPTTKSLSKQITSPVSETSTPPQQLPTSYGAPTGTGHVYTPSDAVAPQSHISATTTRNLAPHKSQKPSSIAALQTSSSSFGPSPPATRVSPSTSTKTLTSTSSLPNIAPKPSTTTTTNTFSIPLPISAVSKPSQSHTSVTETPMAVDLAIPPSFALATTAAVPPMPTYATAIVFVATTSNTTANPARVPAAVYLRPIAPLAIPPNNTTLSGKWTDKPRKKKTKFPREITCGSDGNEPMIKPVHVELIKLFIGKIDWAIKRTPSAVFASPSQPSPRNALQVGQSTASVNLPSTAHRVSTMSTPAPPLAPTASGEDTATNVSLSAAESVLTVATPSPAGSDHLSVNPTTSSTRSSHRVKCRKTPHFQMRFYFTWRRIYIEWDRNCSNTLPWETKSPSNAALLHSNATSPDMRRRLEIPWSCISEIEVSHWPIEVTRTDGSAHTAMVSELTLHLCAPPVCSVEVTNEGRRTRDSRVWRELELPQLGTPPGKGGMQTVHVTELATPIRVFAAGNIDSTLDDMIARDSELRKVIAEKQTSEAMPITEGPRCTATYKIVRDRSGIHSAPETKASSPGTETPQFRWCELPKSVVRHVLSYLAVRELGRLCCTSKQLQQLVDNDDVWEECFRQCSYANTSAGGESEGAKRQKVSWKEVLKTAPRGTT